jgi:hypothetical protein
VLEVASGCTDCTGPSFLSFGFPARNLPSFFTGLAGGRSVFLGMLHQVFLAMFSQVFIGYRFLSGSPVLLCVDWLFWPCSLQGFQILLFLDLFSGPFFFFLFFPTFPGPVPVFLVSPVGYWRRLSVGD